MSPHGSPVHRRQVATRRYRALARAAAPSFPNTDGHGVAGQAIHQRNSGAEERRRKGGDSSIERALARHLQDLRVENEINCECRRVGAQVERMVVAIQRVGLLAAISGRP
jgi:hypothetical protein